ncbi:MAG: hypothetical protein SWZ49_32990 [Cyanobacteriota bacterium]|nr:hypothetical protein [Cyanobacteriota bacterium]
MLERQEVARVHITVYIPTEKLNINIQGKDSLALQEVEMSRIPCVGEFVQYKRHSYKVNRVTHNLDFDCQSLATNNPEAFIDVSLDI